MKPNVVRYLEQMVETAKDLGVHWTDPSVTISVLACELSRTQDLLTEALGLIAELALVVQQKHNHLDTDVYRVVSSLKSDIEELREEVGL